MPRTALAAAAGAALLICLSAWPADARDYAAHSIRVSNPWTRATADAGGSAVGYLTITNDGNQPDRLTGASCPIAESTQLHAETNDNGIMRMRPLTSIEIAPGQTVKLTPRGMHVMLMGTKERLARGSTISCTLQFEVAGPLAVEFAVRSAGATEQLMGPMEQ